MRSETNYDVNLDVMTQGKIRGKSASHNNNHSDGLLTGVVQALQAHDRADIVAPYISIATCRVCRAHV